MTTLVMACAVAAMCSSLTYNYRSAETALEGSLAGLNPMPVQRPIPIWMGAWFGKIVEKVPGLGSVL